MYYYPNPREHRLGLFILIVEDDEDSALAQALMLRLEGYTVELARDGLDAVCKVAEWQPDVVLLDLQLPGIDGYEVARRIRAANLPMRPLLIAISGHGQDKDRRQSLEAGIDLHLVKPADPEKLLQLLQRFQIVLS